jgi:hypothetical protein
MVRMEGLGELEKKRLQLGLNPQPTGLWHSASTIYATLPGTRMSSGFS